MDADRFATSLGCAPAPGRVLSRAAASVVLEVNAKRFAAAFHLEDF
jgi:hypothetical protein